eukprot:gene901-1224_t
MQAPADMENADYPALFFDHQEPEEADPTQANLTQAPFVLLEDPMQRFVHARMSQNERRQLYEIARALSPTRADSQYRTCLLRMAAIASLPWMYDDDQFPAPAYLPMINGRVRDAIARVLANPAGICPPCITLQQRQSSYIHVERLVHLVESVAAGCMAHTVCHRMSDADEPLMYSSVPYAPLALERMPAALTSLQQVLLTALYPALGGAGQCEDRNLLRGLVLLALRECCVTGSVRYSISPVWLALHAAVPVTPQSPHDPAVNQSLPVNRLSLDLLSTFAAMEMEVERPVKLAPLQHLLPCALLMITAAECSQGSQCFYTMRLQLALDSIALLNRLYCGVPGEVHNDGSAITQGVLSPLQQENARLQATISRMASRVDELGRQIE